MKDETELGRLLADCEQGHAVYAGIGKGMPTLEQSILSMRTYFLVLDAVDSELADQCGQDVGKTKGLAPL